MDHRVNRKDFALLGQDPYTFAVLDRILRGDCDLVRTDHKAVILCHSAPPYPVWLWTPDGAADADKETAWLLAEENRPLSAGYRYNLKYELAEYFIEKANAQGLKAAIVTRLFAYDCPSPRRPDGAVEGRLYRCGEQDLEEAVRMISAFHTEIGENPPEREHCVNIARSHIESDTFFFWKNAEGCAVACCSYRENNGLASLGSVYTLPAHRRRHYAQHLVYQVTSLVRDKGLMPMLYTDADYPASNACYEKVGYILRGKLCTVRAQEKED